VNLLVTGGAGFIGSALVRLLRAERPQWPLVTLDALTYAGSLENLEGLESDPGFTFVHGDIRDAAKVRELLRTHAIEAILHLAAESHVDRSIQGPGVFIDTNVGGTQVLLDAAREASVRRFVQVSTDEVYGSADHGERFTEGSPLRPSSPYSASKAAGDLLALAYHRTFGLDVVVTRCSNNYGPRQFPEKLIPLAISRALADRPVPIYGDGQQVRDWLHVDDHCRGLFAALERGQPGGVYNFGANEEHTNLALMGELLARLDKPTSLLTFVADRPGHDRRYALDASLARQTLGWAPRVPLAEGLTRTVEWYRARKR
jgi:dTDP-glucose 4,6-dehydratase